MYKINNIPRIFLLPKVGCMLVALWYHVSIHRKSFNKLIHFGKYDGG
jgi:hypothetical protein